MRRATSSVLLLVGIFMMLVLLNFLFFVETRENEENELTANRSSYRSTAYGTRALYSFLEESNYQVSRFEYPYTDLKLHKEIGTLVVISPPRAYNPTAEEFEAVTHWIESGGLLVIVDREIVGTFGSTAATTLNGDPKSEMRALQPTLYTRGVERVSLSPMATRIRLEGGQFTYHVGVNRATSSEEDAAILADARVGKGRVIFLTDPFVLANNGIYQGDNLLLTLNLFAERPHGKIAFDEYHHGYGSSGGGGLMSYFRGTPVPWMFAQGALIAALVVYTYGRRFARPLPQKRERRTTNLEFVSSMANITRLARATDLAMQNIYPEFRWKLCRFGGVPARADTKAVAQAVAARSKVNDRELWRLMIECEAVSHGQQSSDAELLRMVSKIREIETQLNL